jgi:hypothetical protein
MSPGSRERGARSPHTSAATPTAGRRSGRSVLRWLLVAGAIAAISIGLRAWREPVPQPTSVESSGATRVVSAVATPLEDTPGAALHAGPRAVASQAPAEPSVPRHRVLVLPPSYQHVHPSLIETAKVTGDMIVSSLRAKPDLEIVEIIRAQIRAAGVALSSAGAYRELAEKQRIEALARYFDAEFVIQIGPPTRNWIIENEPAPSGASVGGFVVAVQYLAADMGTISTLVEQPVDPERTAPAIALEVYAKLLPDSAREAYFSILRDTLRSDSDRLTALRHLIALEIPGAAVAVATELARSSSPDTRTKAWAILSDGVRLPIAQAMVDALLYDPEAMVRRQVVDGLANYLSEPNVRSALEGVAVDDASAEVRQRAKWLLLTNDERRALLVETLHDRGLAVSERVAALELAQTSRATANFAFTLDREALEAIIEDARASREASAKTGAIRQLKSQGWLPRQYSDFLIECLGDPAVPVRRAAAKALASRLDLQAQVALSRALADETDADLRDELRAIMEQRSNRMRGAR